MGRRAGPGRRAGDTALFAYGTLRFDEVLAELLDRVPCRSAAAVAGWRAAALAGRVYPGLVRADAVPPARPRGPTRLAIPPSLAPPSLLAHPSPPPPLLSPGGAAPRGSLPVVTGMLITGLTPAELRLIDEYESGPYELELLTLSDGRQGWTYAWTDQAEVLPHDWSPGEFAELHLADFAGKCRAWRDGYEAAGRTGRGIRRPHDPGPDSGDRARPEPGPL